MTSHLQWGILGTGNIAKAFAQGVAHSRTGRLVAVGSRTRESAERFGPEHNIPNRHGSYEALLADPQVQAVYIATPHPCHHEWAIRAAQAGKHILCEKPLAINHAYAMAMIEAAREHDVFLMEAFMYRCHPQTAKLVELLKAQAIGTVRVIQATFSFHAGFNPNSRLFSNAYAGGGILDVGGYCTSLARLVAGVANGGENAEPLEVQATGHLGATGVDEWTVAIMKFPGDILAQLSTGISVQQENVVRIFGSAGHILIPSPWVPSREGGTTKIILHQNGQPQPDEILITTAEWLYGLEADTVAAHLEKRQAAFPAMSWADTLDNLRALDWWRAMIGLTYESEKIENCPAPLAGKPLQIRARHNMTYGRIPGLAKPVARLVMGVDNQPHMPHAAIMFDDYFERGGNCFDTAYIYGQGNLERMLGQWIKSRNVREQVVVIAKGAHPPFCDPANLTKQLLVSLERLQTDGVDIYMMHRDNPNVPVEEFVDVLNEHLRAGRIRAFGGSNWSIPRIAAANEYARAKGLVGFSVVSNNFSLARMVEPVWGGCVAASDPESRAWLTKTQMPLLAWSSQARGFFTNRADLPAERQPDKSMVHSWYSPDNFQRRQRAYELALKYHVQPISIALAYVLGQPFPTFALIGPRTLEETRTSLPGLDVHLTAEELRWLNLES